MLELENEICEEAVELSYPPGNVSSDLHFDDLKLRGQDDCSQKILYNPQLKYVILVGFLLPTYI